LSETLYLTAKEIAHYVEQTFGVSYSESGITQLFKRGRDHEIKSNTGRQRLNINGALNPATQQAIIRYEDAINAPSTLHVFQPIEEQHTGAGTIYIICDNARYYRSKIELLFLPPYAPNLN